MLPAPRRPDVPEHGTLASSAEKDVPNARLQGPIATRRTVRALSADQPVASLEHAIKVPNSPDQSNCLHASGQASPDVGALRISPLHVQALHQT